MKSAFTFVFKIHDISPVDSNFTTRRAVMSLLLYVMHVSWVASIGDSSECCGQGPMVS